MAAGVSKEATLSEVLAEVSILDIGVILKQALTMIGCLGILILIGVGVEMGANLAMPSFQVPALAWWLFWFVVVWGWLHEMTGNKTYHRLEFSWYFPKLRWWSSLLLTAYVFGAIKLNVIAYNLDVGTTRTAVAIGIWLYLMPFIFTMTVLETGHRKLMEKRQAAASAAEGSRNDQQA
jgi:hypothetical protein